MLESSLCPRASAPTATPVMKMMSMMSVDFDLMDASCCLRASL
jgi:hypothetical protein